MSERGRKVIYLESGNEYLLDWYYPEIYDRSKQSFIEISLVHTRAADNIRIKYDSGRNGYIIEQDAFIQQDGYSESKNDWKEVAFIESWQREVKS